MRTAAFLLAVMLEAGCAGSDETASISFREFTVDVVCDAYGACVDGDGTQIPGRDIACGGFMSRQASSFAPHGLYVFWSYEVDGRYVEVELDFPTDAVGQVPSSAALREFVGGREVFRTDISRGMVNLVRAAPDAPALSGSFELMFVDFGQDGREATDDDAIRFLRHGTFSVSRRILQAAEDGTGYCYDHDYRSTWDSGVVFDIWIAPDSGDESSGTYAYDEAEGCEGDTWDDTDTVDDYDDGEGGCEGDTYDDSSDEYDSGCGDETWGDEGDGCEGDDYSDSGGDGCDSDSDWGSDGGGCDLDCEGDTYYGKAKPRKGGGTSLARLMPIFIPFLLRRLLRSRRKET